MIEIENGPASDGASPIQTEHRPVWQAMRRGLAHRCPACGEGQLYNSYLKVAENCANCGEELHHHRADDAPPYMTIFIVGHIVIPGLLLLEKAYAPPTWVHLSIWLPLLVILSLVILPRVKGALVGLQWALKMHGFDKDTPDEEALVARLAADRTRAH